MKKIQGSYFCQNQIMNSPTAQKPNIMITHSVKGYWNEKKEKLRQKYPDITEEDLSYNEGKEKVMLEILGYKLGKTDEELRSIIVNL